MTVDDVVNEIDQLHANIGEVFGRNSDTYRAASALYKLASKEAAEIEEHQGLSDAQEYAAAHAHQSFTAARAINSGR